MYSWYLGASAQSTEIPQPQSIADLADQFLTSGYNDYGLAALDNYDRFGHVADLDYAIEQFTTPLDNLPPTSPLRPSLHLNLGATYERRFEKLGKSEDADLAIQHYKTCVDLTPAGSHVHPERMTQLARAYRCRFESLGTRADVDQAIEWEQKAVDQAPPGNQKLPQWLSQLGILLCLRFERFGDVKDLHLATDHQQRAVDLSPPDSAKRTDLLATLGGTFIRHFKWSGELKDINRAIDLLRQVVELTPPDHEDRHKRLNNLGIALRTRFQRLGQVGDIDTAIEVQQEALNLIPADNSGRPNVLTNLANSFLDRFDRLKQVKDIDTAIQYHQEAISLSANSTIARLHYTHNLGDALISRYKQLGDMEDLNQAILRLQEALDLISGDNLDQLILLSTLGGAFRSRFEKLGREDDANLAVEYQQKAFDLTPADSAIRVARLHNLSAALVARFRKYQRMEDIDKAIQYEQQVVALTSTDSIDHADYLFSLGFCFTERCLVTAFVHDYKEALSASRQASLSTHGTPIVRMHSALFWARAAHIRDDFENAAQGYTQAIRLLPTLAWIGLGAVAQLAELTPQIQTLACDAAACMIALAEASPGPRERQEHLAHALELLDQGRSILWSQTSTLRQDMADLRAADAALAEELDAVGRAVADGCFRPTSALSEGDARAYRRAAGRWEELVTRVRAMRGFGYFLLPAPFAKMREAARGGAVVVVNVSTYRCDVLVVREEGDVVVVLLPKGVAEKIKVVAGQVRSEARGEEEAEEGVGVERHGGPQGRRRPSQLNDALNVTWMLLGEPLVKELEKMGMVGRNKGEAGVCRVWWCLTGQLAFLPIHASHPPGALGPGMMDLVVSSYTPTIAALLRSRQRTSSSNGAFHMLAIGMSLPVGRLPALDNVREELATIRQLVPAKHVTVLEDEEATTEAVASALANCTWAHFACHGIQDPREPMDSGLLMPDARLTLSRLAQCSLAQAQFAFLSSCQSAKGSSALPDEAVHLAAGLQFVGFRGVVGTMWSVNDSDACDVARRVYEEVVRDKIGEGEGRVDSEGAAMALNRAVRYLRDVKKVPLARWVLFIHFGV